MLVQRLDSARLVSAFNIACQRIHPTDEFDAPFNALWNVVRPGGATKLHRHHEAEAFFVVQGRGEVSGDDGTTSVEVGDVILIPPLRSHTLTNLSTDADFLFLNVYWEDMRLLLAGEGTPRGATPRVKKRVAVFGSPPNPNGDLHLGHLAGPYLSADIYARFCRMRGDDAYYLLGSDDNQCWTAAMAAQKGTTPQALADRYSDEIQQTLASAEARLELFYRPNQSPYHRALTETLYQQLWLSGHLVARDAAALFCDRCDLYLFEFYVTGRCPHCHRPSCGNACEECGRPNQCVDLVDPICRNCGGKPRLGSLRRLFFPLQPHHDFLRRYHASVAMSTQHRALCNELLAQADLEIVASHQSSWGIPVPLPGFEGQIVSAWLEMLPGYLGACHQLADRLGLDNGWEAFAKSEDGEIVQFFGFDNCWNHAVLYPALLHALDGGAKPPTAFVSNQLYFLDHKKFSTSRGHAVWGRDLLSESSADAVRLYLAHTCPEAESTNFSRAEFVAWVEQELMQGWEQWGESVIRQIEERFAGEVPEAGSWTEDHRRFLILLKETVEHAEAAFSPQSFSLQRAVRCVADLVRQGRDFGLREESWGPASRDERRTGTALLGAALSTLAMVVAPIAPSFANRAWQALGYVSDATTRSWDTIPRFVPPGQRVRTWTRVLHLRKDSRTPVAF